MPLIACAFVITDSLTGQRFVKAIFNRAYGRDGDGASAIDEQQQGDGGDTGVAPNQAPASSDTGRKYTPRVDVEKIKREALENAENAKGLREWNEKRKGVKDRIREIDSKLDRLLEDD